MDGFAGIGEIHVVGEADLLQVADAFDGVGFCFRFRKRRQEHARKDGDDRDYDEQFDEGESGLECAL